MDWDEAIERNGQALKRILVALVAMAGLGSRTHLPRRLHRACLRLLRPAESAARRLVIVAARGLAVTLPPTRPRKATPRTTIVRNGGGTGIVIPAGYRIEGRALVRLPARSKPARLSLPLFDTLPRFAVKRRTAVSGMPRISGFGPGHGLPFPAVARPRIGSGAGSAARPDDPISADRLKLRVEALGRALDDLPGEARRFARWRAMRVRSEAGTGDRPGRRRFRRLTPLRPGRPPGAARKPMHEVHEVLADLNFFALRALERPDTS